MKNKDENIRSLKSQLSITIDSYSKEIGEKSQTIQRLTSELKKMGELEQNYKRLEIKMLDLNRKIVQNENIIEKNELNRLAEKNKYLEELKLKSEEIRNLKENLLSLESISNEKKNELL